uniref:Ion-translocating oxidoreductase complex subunit D n=1 Tax=Candidatus Caldatribacterium saccharofermentans TaxID=1454753 RepID=A0A7V4TET4_9BACT
MEDLKLITSAPPHLRSPVTVPWIMQQVVFALLPAAIWGAVFFGPRLALPPLVLAVLACVGFEALDCLAFRRPLTVGDWSAVVTGMLLGLSLPPGCPFWIPIVGGGVAIFLGKQMFGGIGQNVFNPALVGRAVLLISWPKIMATWHVRPPFVLGATSYATPVDVVTSATPLGIVKAYGYPAVWETPHLLFRLFVGLVPGCIGEISALLLLLGFVYLLARGVVQWDIPLFYSMGLVAVALVARQNPLFHLLAGGAVMGACFMATDYTTSPMTPRGRIIFGFGAGALTGIIRWLGGYPEGVTFGILTMNALVPLLDRMLPRRFGVKKA